MTHRNFDPYNDDAFWEEVQRDTEARKAAPLAFAFEALEDLFRHEDDEERGHVRWQRKMEQAIWWADDAIQCLELVMASPPANLVAVSSPFYQTNRLYALDSGGALWVSVTGGRTWSPVRARGLPAGAAAISARRAATDDPDWLFVAAGTAGLWRSHDFGASFRRLPGIADATAVATTPHDATRVLVAGPAGLWLSTDNGAGFRKVLDRSGITAIALDTRNWKNGYATLRDGRMLRSDDGGDTWGVPR